MKEDFFRDKDAGKHCTTTLGGFSYLKSIPNMGADFVSIFTEFMDSAQRFVP
ncbi:MAG: hypothetical protein MI799_08125 [Desulfobacterales bacterium]|nr:hypothetical protein [Desulfobacterales bacterium]